MFWGVSRFANTALRRTALPLLRTTAMDIRIHHHWTGDRFVLNTWKHKGFWYYGKQRKHDNMVMFERLIRRGEALIEVGAHIGYLSVYFSSLTEPVYSFEPCTDNLRYLKRNAALCGRAIESIGVALSDRDGVAEMITEDATGENNTLLEDYAVLYQQIRAPGVGAVKLNRIQVPVRTLDSFCEEHGIRPGFIKIDAEGSEYHILKGGVRTLEKHRPAMMAEVLVSADRIADLLRGLGYMMFNDQGRRISMPWENTFLVHRDDTQRLALLNALTCRASA